PLVVAVGRIRGGQAATPCARRVRFIRFSCSILSRDRHRRPEPPKTEEANDRPDWRPAPESTYNTGGTAFRASSRATPVTGSEQPQYGRIARDSGWKRSCGKIGS